jgi:hypothetical protein
VGNVWDTSDAEVQRVFGEAAIRRITHRYAWAIDRFDWELLKSCYFADATHHHGAFRGSVDEFQAWAQAYLETWELTSHLIGTQMIDIAAPGDVAWADTLVWAYHRTPGAGGAQFDLFGCGRYFDRFERRAGDWRIAHRKAIFSGLVRIDEVSAMVPFEIAKEASRERAWEGPLAARGRTDPSYQRV